VLDQPDQGGKEIVEALVKVSRWWVALP
jgi:hypothetical protein